MENIELKRCESCKHYSSDEELNKADFRTCIECTKKILKESGRK